MIRRLIVSTLLLSTGAAFALAQSEKKEAGKDKKPDSRIVTMDDKRYDPAKLTISVGEKVTWKNADDHDHTVIADDKSFKSENISPGDSFEHTFKKAGTFRYSCKYHPRMKGTIVVEK